MPCDGPSGRAHRPALDPVSSTGPTNHCPCGFFMGLPGRQGCIFLGPALDRACCSQAHQPLVFLRPICAHLHGPAHLLALFRPLMSAFVSRTFPRCFRSAIRSVPKPIDSSSYIFRLRSTRVSTRSVCQVAFLAPKPAPLT